VGRLWPESSKTHPRWYPRTYTTRPQMGYFRRAIRLVSL